MLTLLLPPSCIWCPPWQLQVGNTFVSKFYDMLAKHPGFLHGFYKDVSTFTIADMQNGESAPRSASDTKVGSKVSALASRGSLRSDTRPSGSVRQHLCRP